MGSSELRASTTPLDAGPLSPAQRRLWFQHLLDPASDVYNLAFTLRFSGDLVIGALEEAVRDVLGRHRVLRTTYTTGPDGPLQRVGDGPAVDLTPVAVPSGGLDDFVRSHPRKSFDLEASAPLRFRLYRTADTEHVLAIVVHHIVADGWSLDPLSTDLARPTARASRGGARSGHRYRSTISTTRGGRTHTSTRTSTTGWNPRRRPHRIVAAAGPGPIGDGEPRGRRGSRRASR
ncbi:hypothetical protein GS497_26050 [Rhodococcus hoagii]|nr:hypothetical protein [Prescottella equi]